MTTEDDFQAALDANPDDWQTRMVFGDWLDDRDDPRAEGYRALGALRVRPVLLDPDSGVSLIGWSRRHLPWLDDIRANPGRLGWRTRREAEDAAALGFRKLPKKRRVELLKQEVLS